MAAGQTALGTDAVAPAVGAALAAGVTHAVGVVQVLAGAGSGSVLQGQGAVGVFGQSEGHLDAGGHIELVGVGNTGIGIDEGGSLGSALEALGHVPVGIVTGLDAHIALDGEGSGELTGGELEGAQIGCVFFTAVVGAVDETKQVVIHHHGLIRLGGDGAPGTAAAVPGAICHGVAVGTVGGDGQIGSLVPLVIPAVGAVAGVHTAKDHAGVSAGDGAFINAVTVGVGHAGPDIAWTVEEIRRKARAINSPIGVGLQIERVGRSGKRRHGHHADEHAQHQQGTEEFGYSSFHGLPP